VRPVTGNVQRLSHGNCLSHGNVESKRIPFKSIWVGETSKDSLFPGGWRFTQASTLQSIRLDINVDIYHIKLNALLNMRTQETGSKVK